EQLQSRLKELQAELNGLRRLNLRREVQALEEAKVRERMVEAWRETETATMTLLESAQAEVTRLSPGVRRRAAAFADPSRAAALLTLFAALDPPELLHFAKLAREADDHVAAFALVR